MKTQTKRHIDHYLPVEFPAALGLTNDENHVHLSIGYNEGGTNYFSGNNERRGFTVSVSAVKKEDGSISFIIGGSGYGRRYSIVAAARFNATILNAIDAALVPKHAEIATLALQADYDGLRALLTAACAGIGQPKAKATRTTLAAIVAESNAKHWPAMTAEQTARLAQLDNADADDPTSVEHEEWKALRVLAGERPYLTERNAAGAHIVPTPQGNGGV